MGYNRLLSDEQINKSFTYGWLDLSLLERQSTKPIPLTDEQIVYHIGLYYGDRLNPVPYGDCQGLVEFIRQCRLVMDPVQAMLHIRGSAFGLGRTIRRLYQITDHDQHVTLTANYVKVEKQRKADIQQAIEHLKKAAKLIGMRECFYFNADPTLGRVSYEIEGQIAYYNHIGLPEGEHEARLNVDLPPIYSKNPPVVEGETTEERQLRADINKVLRGYSTCPRAGYHSRSDTVHDAKAGKLSAKSRAVKKIWQHMPEQLKQPEPDAWEPYACTAKIVRFCGLSVDSKYVRKIVNP